VRESPPLVVLILGGAAERWGCPAEESPLALANPGHLERLAEQGRVFGVQLVGSEAEAYSAAPLLAILGYDPETVETARASYYAALHDEALAAEECFVSATFLTLFRDLVADVDPGPLRSAETAVLVRDADAAMRRAGFRLLRGAGARHLGVAPRASVDAAASPPPMLLGRAIEEFAPRIPQHAFAHRLAREALDGHEINEVRRDLGGNGADAIWLWGPGGTATLPGEWDEPVSALGTDLLLRGVCKVAGINVRVPNARTPTGLLRGLGQALKRDRVSVLYARRGVRDALMRERKLRAEGIADLDRHLVGPVARMVESAGARLLVLADTARDSRSGHALGDPVPALLWGAGVEALTHRPFTEAGAAEAGEPLAPGHGLLAYVRHL
jgi:2,3-bisphosphoglycerate-independent phosphoglycerate mutase